MYNAQNQARIDKLKSGDQLKLTAYSICSEDDNILIQNELAKKNQQDDAEQGEPDTEPVMVRPGVDLSVTTLPSSPLRHELSALRNTITVTWETADDSVSDTLMEWFREEPNTTQKF